MNVRTYLLAVRKRWWLVLALALVGAALGVASVVVATPVYVSTVTFYVATSATSSSTSSAFTSDAFAQERANSYAELLSKDAVARAVADDGGVGLSAGQLAGRITGSVDLNTVLVTATVSDSDKARALRITRGLAAAFPPFVEQLGGTGSTDTAVNLSVVSGPTVPGAPVSPRPTLYVALGLFAGLVVGMFAAATRDRLDTAVRSIDTLEGITDTHLLAAVPRDNTARVSPLVWGSRAVSQRAEAYRKLRTALQFVDVDNPVRTIVVTSSTPEEGKSSTSANLALSFADSGRRTVVIEADLRRPKLADYFEVDRTVGLTDVLAGRADLAHVLQPWGDTGLFVLPSGSIPPNPSELLGSRNMRLLLARLRETFDVVVIDTPPVLPVTDATVAAAEADGVVFVIAYGRTKRAQVASAVESLQRVGGRVLGVVLNMSPAKDKGGYGTYGEYTSIGAAPVEPAVDVNVDLAAAAPPRRLRDRVTDEAATVDVDPVLDAAPRDADGGLADGGLGDGGLGDGGLGDDARLSESLRRWREESARPR